MNNESPSDKALSPARIAGRSAFGALMREYFNAGLRRGETLSTAFAAALGVADKRMCKWAHVDSIKSAIAAGDINALPPADLAAFLRFWLARVESSLRPAEAATDPRLLALQLAEEIGELARAARKAMADRRVTSIEWRAMAALFAKIEDEAREARRSCESAERGAR